MKIYIAGPMRGIPYYNAPAFDKAARMLRGHEHEVCSPVEMDRETGFEATDLPQDFDWNSIPEDFDVETCFDRDIAAIRACDAIYLLPGWDESSVGCTMEKAVAEFLNKKILYGGDGSDPDWCSLPDSGFPTTATAKLVNAQGDDDTVILTFSGPLPTDSAERKTYPIYTGFMKYFPRAIAAVAHHSYISNEKHNPGEPLHWSKEKSDDHLDCVGRHMLEEDRVSIAWRAMAELEIALEKQSREKML